MNRIVIGVLLFCIAFISFAGTKEDNKKLPKKMNQIVKVINNKVSKSINSLKEELKYPHSIQEDGTWKTVPIRSWTSGFFPGVLWFTNELNKDNSLIKDAKRWTEGLSSLQYYSGSHDVGFMVYCSFGNGYRLTKNEEYRQVILQTAQTLIKRFNPKVGAIRSWDHSKDKWQYPVIIDNMMNLELLFWSSQNGGSKEMYEVAFKHAETTMQNHFRSDGSTFHVLSYDTLNGKIISKGTHQGFSDSSCWARGQAWAIYGFTMAYRFTKDDRFLKTAQKAADYFITHLPKDKVPYWDFNAPNIPDEPRDASAGAIASSALLELGNYGNNADLQKKYYKNGLAILESLSSDPYFTEGTNFLGLLNHSVGNKPGSKEIDVSLIYGDYYFLEALIRYKNLKIK